MNVAVTATLKTVGLLLVELNMTINLGCLVRWSMSRLRMRMTNR